MLYTRGSENQQRSKDTMEFELADDAVSLIRLINMKIVFIAIFRLDYMELI